MIPWQCGLIRTFPGPEPTPTVFETAADKSTADVDTVYGVAIRQGTATQAPRGRVDAIRAVQSWKSHQQHVCRSEQKLYQFQQYNTRNSCKGFGDHYGQRCDINQRFICHIWKLRIRCLADECNHCFREFTEILCHIYADCDCDNFISDCV